MGILLVAGGFLASMRAQSNSKQPQARQALSRHIVLVDYSYDVSSLINEISWRVRSCQLS